MDHAFEITKKISENKGKIIKYTILTGVVIVVVSEVIEKKKGTTNE